MDDIGLNALGSDLGLVLKSEQKDAVESLQKGIHAFGVLPTGFGKSLSSMFWQKAGLPTRQMQLRSNARQLLSFVRSKTNNIQQVSTPL